MKRTYCHHLFPSLLVGILAVVFLLFGCAEKPVISEPEKQQEPTLTAKLTENCPPDQVEHRIQRWTGTGRYQAVPGKFLGISGAPSVATRAWCYNEKGFSYVFGDASLVAEFQSYGVPPSALVAGLSPSVGDLATYIGQQYAAGITKFNIDEPISQHSGYGAAFVSQASQIVQNYGGTLFVSDFDHLVCATPSPPGHGHDPTGWTIQLAMLGSSAIRGGTHSKWEYNGGTLLTDPRSQWTTLRDALAGYGRFNHGWIQQTRLENWGWGWSYEWTDINDIELQFGHANNLGSVNTIFTWAERYGEFVPEYKLNAFLDLAVSYGWAKREEMLVEDIWCCPPGIILPTEWDCTLVATTDTGQRRWVP